MEKITHFRGHTEAGIFAQALFGSAGAFEKTAGAPPFADWETGEQLRRFISTITRQDRELNSYVLVNALGAGEFFGSNINADYFPWESLKHEGMDYGYQTFLNANAFLHHRNKPHLGHIIYGKPVFSALNIPMKRVELIVKLEREICRNQGGGMVLDRIDRGEFPDVSMGCKVPYDVCSICGNKASGDDDYCIHLKPPPEFAAEYGKNKILPDGRKIFMYNLTPRFFDISFVFIGADKTAKVMTRLVEKGDQVCMGPICALPSKDDETKAPGTGHLLSEPFLRSYAEKAASACDGRRGPCGRLCAECPDQSRCEMDKLASAFHVSKVAGEKLADLVKQVPAMGMKRLADAERPLPSKILDGLATENRLPALLGALSSLGIVLKPQEFQRIVMVRMGMQDRVDRLDDKGLVFRPTDEFGPANVDIDEEARRLASDLVSVIRKYIEDRTVFGEPFQERLAKEVRNFPLPTPRPVKHALLDKVSAAYNGYRRDLLMKLSQAREAVESDPRLREVILGEDLASMFTKKASLTKIADVSSVAYMMGAHLSNAGLLSSTAVANAVAANNPWLLDEEHPA